MSKVTYEIVEHDGGWAYKVDGVFSEPFPSHAAALGRRGAERATRYTWGFAAARLRRLYTDLGARELVACG